MIKQVMLKLNEISHLIIGSLVHILGTNTRPSYHNCFEIQYMRRLHIKFFSCDVNPVVYLKFRQTLIVYCVVSFVRHQKFE